MLATISQVASQLAFVDGLGFDPFFRGLLSVLAAVVALIGTTYLVIATNTGTRQGLLIALAGLMGWMFLMGITWTIYGIGWKGEAPVWELVEINVDDEADNDDGLLFSEVDGVAALTESSDSDGLPSGGLDSATVDHQAVIDRQTDETGRERVAGLLEGVTTVGEITDVDLAQDAALVASQDVDLDDWRYLVAADGTRGEAQASVDEVLVAEGVFAAGDYLPRQFGAFILDGKPVLDEDANMLDRVVHTLGETILHPSYDEEVILIQVQGTVQQAQLPGQAPPVAEVDPDQPLMNVIMRRERGGPVPQFFSGLRFTPAMFTLFSGLLFVVLSWNLHVRDRRAEQIRAASAA